MSGEFDRDSPRERNQWRARCARCKRPAPPADDSPEGQVAQGWVTFESGTTLEVDVPQHGGLLPPNVPRAIARFFDEYPGGLVNITPWPAVEVASVREIHSSWDGTVCGDCLAGTSWDDFQWRMFLHGLAKGGDA
jgi:hypothetical protein